MGVRRDGVLAAFVLAVASVVLVLVDGSVTVATFAIGGTGTIAFEIVTLRYRTLVRRYWERPLVQFGTVLFTLGLIAIGALVAPSAVLSFMIGSVVVYLGVIVVALRRDRETRE